MHVLGKKRMKQPDYRIDVVLPFVESRDLNWQITYKKTSERLGRPVIMNSQRFRSWDNLRYLFRGIEIFMPFVSKVHFIVCAPSQIPQWMNRDNVSIVYHKDIIPKRFRPTFNSCTIEMFLRNIPDLAEHFIYFNDDLFPISEMTPDDFFIGGYPKLHYRKVYYSDTQNMFRHQCKAGLDMIGADFKVFCANFIYKNTHSVVPMWKSTMDKVYEMHKDEIEQSISQFREPYNVNQYIYSYYQYMSGQFVDGTFSNIYTSFQDYNIDQICSIIRNQVYGILCINDSCAGSYFGYYKRRLIDAFEEILPHKSKFEL